MQVERCCNSCYDTSMLSTPLLDGEMADRAQAAVLAIAEALEDVPPDAEGFSLASGLPGLALFFGYLSKSSGRQDFANVALGHLSRAIDLVADAPSPGLGLLSGLSGVAWSWQHLDQLLLGNVSKEATADLDEMILEAVRQSPWRWEWDLAHGLAGIGLYAVGHPDPEFARASVQEIASRLDELAESYPPGIAWKTDPKLIDSPNSAEFPEGRFDQGIAHGTPGVMLFLSSALRRGIAPPTASRLLNHALDWLQATLRPHDGLSRCTYFPPATSASRPGWCYGDPGVALMLLGLDTASGIQPPAESPIQFVEYAAEYSEAAPGVVDAGLCHGAAGLGHLFHRAYRATGSLCLRRSARLWFDRTLEMRRPDRGVAGFLNWWPEAAEWRGEAGLLVGAAGIGLALLSALHDHEPKWDFPFVQGLTWAPPKA